MSFLITSPKTRSGLRHTHTSTHYVPHSHTHTKSPHTAAASEMSQSCRNGNTKLNNGKDRMDVWGVQYIKWSDDRWEENAFMVRKVNVGPPSHWCNTCGWGQGGHCKKSRQQCTINFHDGSVAHSQKFSHQFTKYCVQMFWGPIR